jgi:hypothetical protein
MLKENTTNRAQFAGCARRGIILAALSMLGGDILPARAQETSELAKQAQNPIANVVSVPFENDFSPETGEEKQDSYVLQIKPVMPFKLSDDWTVITRTILPVIQLPDLRPGVNGITGLGDIQESLFLSPERTGPVIWGAGPVVSFPTASHDLLGTGKLSAGPTAVVLTIQGHWLFGVLAQNLFSVAGPSDRTRVNQMLIQPFVNYNLTGGWYLVSSPVITANWKARSEERWLVPVGGGLGRIVHFGKQPVNTYLQCFSNVQRPDGTTPWSLRFQVQFLFTKR